MGGKGSGGGGLRIYVLKSYKSSVFLDVRGRGRRFLPFSVSFFVLFLLSGWVLRVVATTPAASFFFFSFAGLIGCLFYAVTVGTYSCCSRGLLMLSGIRLPPSPPGSISSHMTYGEEQRYDG